MVTKWSGEKGRVLKVEERGGPRKMNKIRIASVVSSQDLRVCLFPVNRGRSFPFRFGGPDRGRPDIKVFDIKCFKSPVFPPDCEVIRLLVCGESY